MINKLDALRKFVAPEFIFGAGARQLVAQYAGNYGVQNALIVTDPGVQAAGWVDDVTTVLHSHRIPHVIFNEVTPNPKDHEVMLGAEIYAQEGCNLIIVVGGGSPIDAAKGIAIVSANKKNILEHEGVDEVEHPGPPLICIPTTAGTSADVSQFAIITDTARKVKIAIISKTVVPDISLVDPETTMTMPRDLTIATGMDVCVHAFESYVSNASSPITDINALEAIRLLFRALPLVVQNPDDIEARKEMMLASLLAGLAFSNASLGAVHAMAHSLGGLLDLPHGETNAVLLPHVITANYEGARQKYNSIAQSLAGRSNNEQDDYTFLMGALGQLQDAIGAPRSLAAFGLTRESIPALATNALRDACIATNPVTFTQRQVEQIYEAAL